MDKVVAIIQAHMSSSRLPGKVMKDLCGEPVLYRMIERLRNCKNLDKIVVATSYMECDDVLIEACEKLGVSTFRGSNFDVLDRFWGAVQAYPAENYIRLTSDCPLIDPQHIDEKIRFFLDNNFRYVRSDEQEVSGCMDGEVFTAELMKENYENATEGYEHEHVTPYMYTKQDSIGYVPSKFDGSKYRLDLDTPEDYAVVQSVYAALSKSGNLFDTADVVKYLDDHPEVFVLNSQVIQKHFTECSYNSFEDQE